MTALNTADFAPSDEAEHLRLVVRRFLAERSSEADVRAVIESGAQYDAKAWKQAATQLGLTGLAIPERFGGAGATPIELGVVFEEMGAALFCVPFLSSIGMAATGLLASGNLEAQAEYLPALAAGDIIATLVWAGGDAAASTLRADSVGGGYAITGTAETVVDGMAAELLLVIAANADGVGLFLVDGIAAGVAREPRVAMDHTRPLSAITFDAAPARVLCLPGHADAAVRKTLDPASLYLAAEQLGGAARVLERSVEYAQTRFQFGRAIGSFQAIKHRCANMLIEIESARSVVQHGLWTAVHQPEALPASAALARAVVSDAYVRAAAANVQIHGGIGFTWEHHAHLYLKRAKSSQLLLGPPVAHRRRLAELLDISGADPIAERPTSTVLSAAGAPPASDLGDLDIAIDHFLAEHPIPDADDDEGDRAFRQARFDAGLAFVHFPTGSGGRGAPASFQSHVEGRFLAAGAADHSERNVIGLGMALPTINVHGSADQRARYLSPGFSGAEIWCQLFSEPGAGSDLAGLATRAVRDGDHFVINGQKVWTSLGHVARHGILLARTDPDVPKHRGLTYFLLDMRTPGVEVRPLRQLTGEAEFNEVYLTDVRVPADAVVGEVGQGWQVAMTTLAGERVSLGARPMSRGGGPIAQAVSVYRHAASTGRVDAATTERLMLLWTRAEAARLTNLRASRARDLVPGPEGAIAKLEMAELNQTIYEFCVDLSGSDGLLVDDYTETAPAHAGVHGQADVRKAYLRSLANSIEGGTSEILRDVLGGRVLGLPSEPRVDREIPWKDLPRS